MSFGKVLLCVCLSGCVSWQDSELKELKENNAIREPILRKENDVLIRIETPHQQPRDPYPWEKYATKK